jgi:hypothetical protein
MIDSDILRFPADTLRKWKQDSIESSFTAIATAWSGIHAQMQARCPPIFVFDPDGAKLLIDRIESPLLLAGGHPAKTIFPSKIQDLAFVIDACFCILFQLFRALVRLSCFCFCFLRFSDGNGRLSFIG